MEDFSIIYRQSVQKVYHFLLGLTRNPELAEELTEETFIRRISIWIPFGKSARWIHGCARSPKIFISKSESVTAVFILGN